MADYIDRTTAINVAQNPYHVWSLAMATADDESEINLVHSGQELCNAVERVFKIAPPADVAPVRHEMWEEYSTSRFYGFDKAGDPIYRDVPVYYCSSPKCRRKTIIKEKYCPNCGAKMDGGADDEV